MDAASLLPPAAGPLERALEQAAAEATALEVPLRGLWRPAPPPPAPPATPPEVWARAVFPVPGAAGDTGVRVRARALEAHFDRGVRLVYHANRHLLPGFHAAGEGPFFLQILDFRPQGDFRVFLVTARGARAPGGALPAAAEHGYRLAIRHHLSGRAWDFAFAADTDPRARYAFPLADYAEADALFEQDPRFDVALYDARRLLRDAAPPPPQVWTDPVTPAGGDDDHGVRLRAADIAAYPDRGIRLVKSHNRGQLPGFDGGGPAPVFLRIVDFRPQGDFRVFLATAPTGAAPGAELTPENARRLRFAVRHHDTGRTWDFAFAEDIDPSSIYTFPLPDYPEAHARYEADNRWELAIYDPGRLRRRPPALEPGPHACPTAALPWLAWALGVSDWNPAAPEGARRRVVAGAAREARRRGTRAALLAVLREAGAVFTISERHAGPFTCRIEIHNSAALPAADLAAIEPALRTVGRASVRCTVVLVEGFFGAVVVDAGLGAAAVAVAFFELEA